MFAAPLQFLVPAPGKCGLGGDPLSGRLQGVAPLAKVLMDHVDLIQIHVRFSGAASQLFRTPVDQIDQISTGLFPLQFFVVLVSILSDVAHVSLFPRILSANKIECIAELHVHPERCSSEEGNSKPEPLPQVRGTCKPTSIPP